MSAPSYSLQRRRSGQYHGRLSKWDVEQIREWVRREGYGLAILEQSTRLQAERYPTISERTIRDVINNATWFDPSYDPSVPLCLPQVLTCGGQHLSWFFALILLWRSINLVAPTKESSCPSLCS